MEKTIIAIATALGNGSISIIRLSGIDSINIVNQVFEKKDLTKVDSHTINYGYITYDGEIIDEVMVTVMKAPKTYTREDVVEINCHGGIYITKKILDILIKKGASLAEPGEFTKRAFLNGRIDLAQAEAVMDMINAKSNIATKNSINQLTGKTKNKIDKLRDEIIEEIAYIEAALDDPEHYEMEDYGKSILDKVNSIREEINKLIMLSENGKIIREGINTAIIGLPNAGKSSLLNYLSNSERAIVTDIEGTTRDIIEEKIILDDIVLNVIDTAGIRKTEDIVEKIGVNKSMDTIDTADLILYIIDASKGIREEEKNILEKIKNKKNIIVINKIDKHINFNYKIIEKDFSDIVEISLIENIGLEKLVKKIKDVIINNDIESNDDLYIANERQKVQLIEARESIERVIESINDGFSEDFINIDLTAAYSSLGKILGKEVEDDIINKIFKDFCMGK